MCTGWVGDGGGAHGEREVWRDDWHAWHGERGRRAGMPLLPSICRPSSAPGYVQQLCGFKQPHVRLPCQAACQLAQGGMLLRGYAMKHELALLLSLCRAAAAAAAATSTFGNGIGA